MSLNKDKSLYFHQLGVTYEAGIPIANGLSLMESQAPSGPLRSASKRMRKRVLNGSSLQEAFQAERGLFSSFELELIGAGETTGKLEIVLKALSDWLGFLLGCRRVLFSGLAYPALIMHAVIVIQNLPAMVVGSLSLEEYLMATLKILIPVYGILFFLFVLLPKARRSLFMVAYVVDAVTMTVPILRGVLIKMALARFALALKCMVESGIPIIKAIELAASASGNQVVAASLERAIPRLKQGDGLTESLKKTKVISRVGLEFIRTGEESGKLESMLGKLSEIYQQDAEYAIKNASEWVPRIAYLAMAGLAAHFIIKSYSGVVGQYNEILKELP